MIELKFPEGQPVLSRHRLADMSAWCREMALPISVLVGILIFGAPVKDVYPLHAVVAQDVVSLTADITSATQISNTSVATAPAKNSEQVKTNSDRVTLAATSLWVAPNAVGPDTLKPVANQVMAALDPSATASLSRSLGEAAQTGDVNKASDSIQQLISGAELVDECLVIDICVDRYLWQLYERTPKEDTIRERLLRFVSVKRKGKMVTVTRASTTVKDQNFGWKDFDAADKVGMPLMDYVIGGTDREFKLRLFQMLHAAELAGLGPGITSCFRDDYRQSIANGLKAANDRSFHGGSLHGGYGHGLAADIVSIKGASRAERMNNSQILWKWVDDHGSEFGIGRPYLRRDPPHVAPIDGEEFARHRPGYKSRQAAALAIDASPRN
jgi:hypothetical protein